MLASDQKIDFEILPLYKYHPCPGDDSERMEWVRQILIDHQLFFANRQLFNDPFDCVVPRLSEISGTILKRYVEEFVDRKFSDVGEDKKVEMIKNLMSVSALKKIRQGLQDEVDRAGIVCFSEVRDDILMWAHYADKHKGLCFEFDGSSNCRFFGEAQPVDYEDYTPIPLHENRICQMRRIILTKSKHWLYEKEYRIIHPEKACKKLDYPVELLTGIIFGCNMLDKVRETVKQWVEKGNCRVAFFEARPKITEFGLDIFRID